MLLRAEKGEKTAPLVSSKPSSCPTGSCSTLCLVHLPSAQPEGWVGGSNRKKTAPASGRCLTRLDGIRMVLFPESFSWSFRSSVPKPTFPRPFQWSGRRCHGVPLTLFWQGFCFWYHRRSRTKQFEVCSSFLDNAGAVSILLCPCGVLCAVSCISWV